MSGRARVPAQRPGGRRPPAAAPDRGRWRWLPTLVGLLVSVMVLASHGVAPSAAKPGRLAARVTSRSHAGNASATIRAYTNPLRAISSLRPGRIDMGADFDGSGPVEALGDGTVTEASDHDTGPPSCYGRTCWPVGGIVVYELANGPFAGKYVYLAESVAPTVRAGQTVIAGQEIATARDTYPYVETGWASGNGPETLAIADGHQCPCGDPGGWSTIEGRNFNQLLTALGAPSAILQPHAPRQSMPAGWPRLPEAETPPPSSPTRLSQGSTTR